MQTTVTIHGPQSDRYFSDTKRIEVQIRISERPKYAPELEYFMSLATYTDMKTDLFLPPTADFNARYTNVWKLEELTKDLRSLYKYADKLPVRPKNSLADWMCVILSRHKIKNVDTVLVFAEGAQCAKQINDIGIDAMCYTLDSATRELRKMAESVAA